MDNLHRQDLKEIEDIILDILENANAFPINDRIRNEIKGIMILFETKNDFPNKILFLI